MPMRLLTFAHVFAFYHRQRIIELANRHKLPAMYGWREYADVGGLMTYGPNVAETLRRAASYVDRHYKGPALPNCRSNNRPNLNW